MINAYYCSTENNSKDFGQTIENDPDLQQALYTSVLDAIQANPPEDITGAIFDFFNKIIKNFRCKNLPLPSNKRKLEIYSAINLAP